MEPIEQFRDIAKQATIKLAQTFQAPDLVPFGESLLKLISEHPGMRQDFCREFVRGFHQRSEFDLWVLEFCMHALRWPELKAEFEVMSAAAVARKEWNLIQPLGHVLDAFEDGWEDARDFYAAHFYPAADA